MQDDLSSAEASLEARTASLRNAFDDAFQAPPRPDPEATLDVLTLAVGEDLFAVRVEDVSHVQAHPVVVGMPDLPRACLGVAGHRGKLVAVFDLARLLGRPPVGKVGVLLVARDDPSVGFAVAAIERYLRVPRSSIAEPADDTGVHIGTLLGDRKAVLVSLERVREALTAEGTLT
jgi:chemotaxis signal transduction protein